LTPGAVRSPWVNFEAGAIAKAVPGPSHVSPLLLGVTPRDLGSSPLAMFQCTEFTEQDVERLLQAMNAFAIAPIPEPQVAARLQRTWAVLHGEIGRIDFSNTNDADQETARDDDTVDDWLHEIEDKILEHVAWAGDDQPLNVMQIARAVGEDHVMTQHYVDQLVGRGFLHDRLSVARPTTYLVTRRGRAHLVERLL
jgi:predicted transcriptional regulator